jgi:hypothetical protein
MPNTRIRYKPKLSLKQARDKITIYGMYGNHDVWPRPKNRGEVAQLLRSMGINPDELVEKCRDYTETVTCFEGQRLNIWSVNTYKGGKFGLVDITTGETIAELDGPGFVAASAYLVKFETACEARNRAVEKASFAEYEAAIVNGFASIEAYVAEAASHWNRTHSQEPLVDSSNSKVNLVEKLDVWVPKMTEGTKLIKNDQRWNDFLKLKKVRDNIVVHPKVSSYVIPYKKLCELINAFRCGIAGMLGQLHLVFCEPVPAAIINAFYMPDVEIVDEV